MNALVATKNPSAFADAQAEARLAREACKKARVNFEHHRHMHGC
jgi:hypothetical protein